MRHFLMYVQSAFIDVDFYMYFCPMTRFWRETLKWDQVFVGDLTSMRSDYIL